MDFSIKKNDTPYQNAYAVIEVDHRRLAEAIAKVFDIDSIVKPAQAKARLMG